MPTCFFPWKPNAPLQARGAAAATQERRLFPVACKRWFGWGRLRVSPRPMHPHAPGPITGRVSGRRYPFSLDSDPWLLPSVWFPHTPPPCTYLLHHLVCQDEEPLGEG